MRKIRGISLRLTNVVAIVFIISSVSFFASSTVFAQNLERVTVSSSIETLDSMLPQIGEWLGIMEKHGLNLSFVKGPNGPAMVNAVVGGTADITHVSTALYFPAIKRGGDFRFLAQDYKIDYRIIGQKDLKWPNLSKGYPALVHDLKGKKIGVAGRGGATELMVRKMLTDAGLNPDKDVTYISVGTGFGAAGAFINKQVDAMVDIPPEALHIGSDNFILLVDLQMSHQKVYSPDHLFCIFAANTDFVEKRPEVAKSFCSALKETLAYARKPENRADVIKFLSVSMNLKPEMANQLWDGYGGNFELKLTKKAWEGMSKFEKFIPDWNKYVYQPCVEICSE